MLKKLFKNCKKNILIWLKKIQDIEKSKANATEIPEIVIR